jgi:hypothetical protein
LHEARAASFRHQKVVPQERYAFATNTVGGKGSHIKVYVGADRWTIVKSGELSSLYVDAILKQLGISREAIKR